jgi:hypothetical protein
MKEKFDGHCIDAFLWMVDRVMEKYLSPEAAQIVAVMAEDSPSAFMRDPKLQDPSVDRRKQYTDPTPEKLLQQLNENWRQLRIFQSAVGDRDRVISEQHEQIRTRDQLIKRQNTMLKYAKIRLALLYSLVGGVAFKGAEVFMLSVLHWKVLR